MTRRPKRRPILPLLTKDNYLIGHDEDWTYTDEEGFQRYYAEGIKYFFTKEHNWYIDANGECYIMWFGVAPFITRDHGPIAGTIEDAQTYIYQHCNDEINETNQRETEMSNKKSTSIIIKDHQEGDNVISLRWSILRGYFFVINGNTKYFDKGTVEDVQIPASITTKDAQKGFLTAQSIRAQHQMTLKVINNPEWTALFPIAAARAKQAIDTDIANKKEKEMKNSKPIYISQRQAEELHKALDFHRIQQTANELYGWRYKSNWTYLRTNVASDPQDHGKPGDIYAGSEHVGYVGVNRVSKVLVLVFDRNDGVLVTPLDGYMLTAEYAGNPATFGTEPTADDNAALDYSNDIANQKEEEKEMTTTPTEEKKEMDPATHSLEKVNGGVKCVNYSKLMDPTGKTSYYHKSVEDLRECMNAAPAPVRTSSTVGTNPDVKTEFFAPTDDGRRIRNARIDAIRAAGHTLIKSGTAAKRADGKPSNFYITYTTAVKEG